MHVLYITKTMPFGAQEAFIFPEIEEHLRAGWDITIVPVQRAELIHKGSEALLARTLGFGLFSRKMLMPLVRLMVKRPLEIPGSIAPLLRVRPKLALRNLAVWLKGVWLAEEARRRNVDHIHVHWIAVPATMGLVASRLSGIPMSITCHRYDIDQNNLISEKFAASAFVRAIDTIGAEELERRIPVREKRPQIIHMGVDLPETTMPLREGPLTRMRAIIGARFVEKKGHGALIRAVAEARSRGIDVEVDAYGDGPLETALRQLASDLGVNDLFHFKGVTSHKVLLQRIRSGEYDVAVLPSVTASDGDKEGIPVFLMESMAAGLPVIATPNGGIRDLIVQDGGTLVPETDEVALADAFVTLAADGDLRASHGANGRRMIESQFSSEGCSATLRDRIGTAGKSASGEIALTA